MTQKKDGLCKGLYVGRLRRSEAYGVSTGEHGHARCEKWAHIHFFASVRLPLLTPLFLLQGRSANPSYSGKSLRSKVFHSAELSGFVRLALLA